VLDFGIDGLFDQVSCDVILGLVADLRRDGGICSSLDVLFALLLALVSGLVLASPLFGERESRAKWPGALIGVAISAWPGKRTVGGYLAVVDGCHGSTPLGPDTDAVMALLGNAHAVDDDRCGRSVDGVWNGRPQLVVDRCGLPGILSNEPFETFLISTNAGGQSCDGLALTRAKQGSEVLIGMDPGPFPVRPGRAI